MWTPANCTSTKSYYGWTSPFWTILPAGNSMWSIFFTTAFRTELDFTVAIDFTKSNLPVDDQSSLHRLDTENANQYEMAIASIAEICQHYSRSKIFKAYGFGAKLPTDNKVHYHFPLVRMFGYT